MKRIFSAIIALVAVISLQAENTEVVRLTLTAEGSPAASYITVRVDPTVMVAETGSYFENTELAENVNIYVAIDESKYSSYKLNEIANLPVNVLTNRRPAANQHYTITFNVPTRTEGLKLFDSHAEQVVDIIHDATYEFDVNTTLEPGYVEGTNYEVVDRFVINVSPAPESPLETCFTGTALNINKNPYWYSNIVVKKTSDGSTIKSYDYGTSSIDFNEKDGSGNNIYANNTEYTVYFDKGNHAFIVKVKR